MKRKQPEEEEGGKRNIEDIMKKESYNTQRKRIKKAKFTREENAFQNYWVFKFEILF